MNFKSPDWVQDTIFYQIFPDRFNNGNLSNSSKKVCKWGDKPVRDDFFGGDLEGIIRKLPYLGELGVNALYLNPIFKSPSNHKYNTTDYYKIDPSFGDKNTLKRLVKELHWRKMRIILDGVFNHCGDTFWAFQDVMEKGSKSKNKDWFIIKNYPIVKYPEPNYRCWMGVSSMP
ncbi:Neopullulanase 2 [subsurface metagenome]